MSEQIWKADNLYFVNHELIACSHKISDNIYILKIQIIDK